MALKSNKSGPVSSDQSAGSTRAASGKRSETVAPAGALERVAGAPTTAATDVLELQQLLGNQTVQRLLANNAEVTIQRDDGPPLSSIDASMFTYTGGTLQHKGTVTATPADADGQLLVQAPHVSYSATVEKTGGGPIPHGDYIQVGTVQTLNSSKRTGVYRRGGDPRGEVIARHNDVVGQTWDAKFQDDKGDGSPYATAPEPFYTQPRLMYESSPKVTVNFLDTPQFPLPESVGAGILTEVEGSESFTTALAVKYKTGDAIYLKTQNWTIDWTMPVTPTAGGTGEAVQSSSTTDEPAVTSGKIVPQVVRSWIGFPTADAAMAVDTPTLLLNLAAARQHDPDSFNNIVSALERKNPSIKIWLQVEDTAEWMGADEVEVTLSGSSSVSEGPLTLNDMQQDTFDFKLLDVVDLSSLDKETEITISAADVGGLENAVGSQSWQVPFGEKEFTLEGSGAKYSIIAEML